ncbi:dihydroorotase [Neisseria gonorrhoeae]|uniref:Dihydroorotase n=1 Tax=Neisseria gonorrhoeae TaxID=485 RepID=A0A378W141_NEIGO|nr:dihydroorotase [Neisseria gonorrhoeae]
MKPVLAQVPNLKVVFEHITTAEAARLVWKRATTLPPP